MVKANDITPRRAELRKRLIHESPAPEMPNTPISEVYIFRVMIIFFNYLSNK